MRYLFALTLPMLPIAASAASLDGSGGAFPVTKCDPFSSDSLCATYDGSHLRAAHGAKRSAQATPALHMADR